MVVDIRQLKFTPAGTISYKLTHDEYEEFQVLPAVRRLVKPTDPEYKHPQYNQLYKDPLPITNQKWKHLQELKCTIPSFFHAYYDDLPYTVAERKSADPPDEDSEAVISDPTQAINKGMAATGKMKVQKRKVENEKEENRSKKVQKRKVQNETEENRSKKVQNKEEENSSKKDDKGKKKNRK